MSTATVEAVQTKFQILPLAQITPSPMNPRKRFDEKALKELAASIQAHGVQQPIVVRPHGKPGKLVQFEIVVGERRYRASELAGKTEIPALINSLSDAAALEIMVIENLQREDVHPLDEALGYEALMKKSPEKDSPQHTVDSIAAAVGKSVGYVYARLKLLALTPAARKAFERNEITAGHAVLIARLQPDDQERALKACFDQGYGFGSDKGPLIAEKQLRKWLQENIQLNLDKAPFDIADAKLVPSAGACTVCPKRSGTNPALFEGMELGKNACLDPTCYQAKKMALVNINADKLEEKHGEKPIYISHLYSPGKAKQKGVLYDSEYREEYWQNGNRQKVKAESCKDTKLAIYVDGEPDYSSADEDRDSGKGAGKTIHVCTAKNCAVHSDRYSGSGRMGDAAARRQQRIARHFALTTFQAIAAKAKKLTRADRDLIALEFFKKLGHFSETPMIAALGWDKKLGAFNAEGQLKKKFAAMKPDELEAQMLFMAIAPDLNARTPAEPKDLLAVAARYKVNTKQLLEAAKEKFTQKKSQTPAKPAKPAKTAKTKAKAAGK